MVKSKSSGKENSSKRYSSSKSSSNKEDNVLENFTSLHDKVDKKIDNLSESFVSFISFIIALIVIIINMFAIQWIYKLEEIVCKCSEDWKRDYIKYFLIIYFIFIIVQFFSYIVFQKFIHQYSKVFSVIIMIFSLISYANIAISIIYINDLKNIKCECSEDVRREIYYYYNIVSAILIGISLLMAIVGFLSIFYILRTSKI